MNESICKICDNQAQEYPSIKDQTIIICSYCGKYSVTGSFFIEKYALDKISFYKVSSWIREQNDVFEDYPVFDDEKFKEIIDSKDKKIKEKFDFLMQIFIVAPSNISLYDTGEFEIDGRYMPDKNAPWSTNQFLIKTWAKNYQELCALFQKAIDNNLIDCEIINSRAINYNTLTFNGIEYIESLGNPNQFSKNIFVAFNFEDSLKEVFNQHLKQALEKEGFTYVVVNQDSVKHDKNINDEIIAKLKSSRIVIADFTNHRNSVYFEAGFAMGMKIPIIWTCQKGHDKEMSFDIRQFPHIIWKNKDDLVKQVVDRIKVIL